MFAFVLFFLDALHVQTVNLFAMNTVSSYFLDIDVSTQLLATPGKQIDFSLGRNSCIEPALSKGDNGKAKTPQFDFALVRASHCNGVLLPVPLVEFEQTDDRARFVVVEPIALWEPSLVDCARVSLRIEYWPRAVQRRRCQ